MSLVIQMLFYWLTLSAYIIGGYFDITFVTRLVGPYVRAALSYQFVVIAFVRHRTTFCG